MLSYKAANTGELSSVRIDRLASLGRMACVKAPELTLGLVKQGEGTEHAVGPTKK